MQSSGTFAFDRYPDEPRPVESLGNLMSSTLTLDESRVDEHDTAERVVDGFVSLWPRGTIVDTYTDVAAGGGLVGKRIADIVDAEDVHLFDATFPVAPGVIDVMQSESMPLEDASQDLVTAIVATEHAQDINEWIRDVARVVASRGYFYIHDHDVVPTTPVNTVDYLNWVNLVDAARRRAKTSVPFRSEYYSRKDIRGALRDYGFRSLAYRKLPSPNPRLLYDELFRLTGPGVSEPRHVTGISRELEDSVRAYNASPRLQADVRRLVLQKTGIVIDPDIRFETPTQAYNYLVS